MDYPDGRSIPARNAVEIKAQAISPSDYLYYAYQRDLYRGVAGFGCGKLFKRKFFDSPLNLRFDEAYPVLTHSEARPLPLIIDEYAEFYPDTLRLSPDKRPDIYGFSPA